MTNFWVEMDQGTKKIILLFGALLCFFLILYSDYAYHKWFAKKQKCSTCAGNLDFQGFSAYDQEMYHCARCKKDYFGKQNSVRQT